MAPEKRPPTPIPATALPTIRAVLVGAVAHTRELGSVISERKTNVGELTYPSSNMTIAIMKVYLIYQSSVSTHAYQR